MFACAGFLYPPGDYETAVTLTKQLVRDPALRERIGGAARLEVMAMQIRFPTLRPNRISLASTRLRSQLLHHLKFDVVDSHYTTSRP